MLNRPSQLIEEGKEHYLNGEYKTAIKKFNAALSHLEEDVDEDYCLDHDLLVQGYRWLGLSYHMDKFYSGAIEALTSCLMLEKNSSVNHYNLARAYFESDNSTAAIIYYDSALACYQRELAGREETSEDKLWHANIQFNLACALEKRGEEQISRQERQFIADLKETVERFTQAYQLNPCEQYETRLQESIALREGNSGEFLQLVNEIICKKDFWHEIFATGDAANAIINMRRHMDLDETFPALLDWSSVETQRKFDVSSIMTACVYNKINESNDIKQRFYQAVNNINLDELRNILREINDDPANQTHIRAVDLADYSPEEIENFLSKVYDLVTDQAWGTEGKSKWSLFTSIDPFVVDIQSIFGDWQRNRNKYDVKNYQAVIDKEALIKLIGRGQYFAAKKANAMDPLVYRLFTALAKVDLDGINDIENALESGKDEEVLVRFTRRRGNKK